LKNDEVTDFFNRTPYRFFTIQKQFNNIVETTQLTNDQMKEFYCHCEFWSVHHQFQPTTPASSRLIWEIFFSLVDRALWQVAGWSASLSLALVFSFVLSLR